MLENIYKAIFGDIDDKKIKRYQKIIETIRIREKDFEDLTPEQIKEKTAEFKSKFEWLNFKNIEDSKKIREILDEIKVDAFALVKTAAKRLEGNTYELPSGKQLYWNMVHYDVQLIGWLALHEGGISEMKTWEWKTLVASLPAYLNALTWNSVHIVTVNDYLARRDSEEMGLLFHMLWMTVWVVTHEQSKSVKKEAYSCDIVYATNNEMGFDYLRDNMVIRKEDKVQSPLFFAIIDEVDSILVDEARTPLIISMPDNEPTSKYMKFAELIKYLEEKEHYKIDEKQKAATLTESWIQKIEELLKIDNIYISEHYNDLHHIENALKAQAVYKKDKDYIVANDEVLIVDEHTGRVLGGRRYSDGLHQALEAKEKVEIKQESKTLASITFQNFFRMYWKLSGMTGTAKTEEEEFYKVYALDTVVIPTNKPIVRDDRADLLFKNEKGKFEYVVKMVHELHEKGQPILVGTVSVDKSEYLSQKLTEASIPHNVLNAKNHAREAEIVAAAGQKWAVTIATNMAWRGTDIKLWEWVAELGGLFIIGTEKHETRRIDNQLRGRAGRQWDPGATQFLVSPNDDIMRIFGGDKLFGVFNSPVFASLPDDEPLAESGMLTRKVTWVQKQVEGHHFDMRKHVLEYDDVMNKHREIIYTRRNKILESENIHEDILEMIQNQMSLLVDSLHLSDEGQNSSGIKEKINEFFGKPVIDNTVESDDILGTHSTSTMKEYLSKIALEELQKIQVLFTDTEAFFDIERRIVLQSIDELWMKHIDSMSHLREEVAFEGYAQKHPIVVYKERAFEKFQALIDEVEFKTVKALYFINPNIQIREVEIDERDLMMNNDEIDALWGAPQKKQSGGNTNPLFTAPKTGRNKIRV
jgi:preprotein translocase subunit SecA